MVGAKAIRKDAVKMVEATVLAKAKKCKSRCRKEAYEEQKKCGWRREYHFRSDPRRRDNAPSAL